MKPLRHLRVPLALTAGVVLAQAIQVPPLGDPLGGSLDPAWRLESTWLYTAAAPLFSTWDQVAMLSRSRLTGFLLGLGVAFLVWRGLVRHQRRVRVARVIMEESRALVLALAGLACFVGLGMAWNTRPALRLAGVAGAYLTVEIHSHTNASHDVKSWPVSGFDAEASRQWHQRAGVDVLFITDHNLTAGWERHARDEVPGQTLICPGMEVSAHGAHVLVLGTPLPAEPGSYRGSIENRGRLFAEVAASPGAVAIASLPEYRGKAAEFLAEGAGGFEVVNASPKANEFTRVERDSVVALARRHGVAVLAAGDQHGYGATPMAWNVLHQPDWLRLGDGTCGAIVARIKTGGIDAVRIVERTRLRPDHWLPGFLTPLGVLWLAWGTASLAGALSWLGWIWGVSLLGDLVRRRLRERRARAILTAVGAPQNSPSG